MSGNDELEYTMRHFNNISWPVYLIVLALWVSVAAAEETVRMANGEWPPFTSVKLKKFGIYSHIVTESFALEGLKVEYKFFPWSRSYKNVKDGSWDGSLTWAPTPEKKRDVLFSDPVFTHRKVIFHLKRFAFDWNRIEALEGLKIGATREYTYGEAFDQAAVTGRLNVEYTTTDIINLKKLHARRIQIFPSDIDVGYFLIKENFHPEQVRLFTHHERPIQETFTCVIFTKKNPEKSQYLLETFNRGLKKLKAQGRYDELLEAFRRGEYMQNSKKNF